MQQLTKEQAVKFYDSGVWREMTQEQICKMQLFQDRLCVPFDVFHEAVTNVLGRDVYTCEFAFRSDLQKEFLGEKQAPTLEEIVALIPNGSDVIVIQG